MDLFKKSPKPRDSSAITPTSKSNEPGSAIGQVLGKTGGDTYRGLVAQIDEDELPGRQPDDPSDDDTPGDDKRDDDKPLSDLEPKLRFPGPDEEPAA